MCNNQRLDFARFRSTPRPNKLLPQGSNLTTSGAPRQRLKDLCHAGAKTFVSTWSTSGTVEAISTTLDNHTFCHAV